MKEEEKCDLIIALNHMRIPDDKAMANQNDTKIVDMIFGGHDHCYFTELDLETGVFIQKSGTDFETFGNITALFGVKPEDAKQFESDTANMGIDTFYDPKQQRLYIHERIEITDKFQPDAETVKHIHSFTEDLNAKLDKPAIYSEVDLDCRFSRVRTEETNLGNLCADLMRTELNCDLALSNGGCLRANCIFDKGILTYRFFTQTIPMEDHVVPVKLTGELLLGVIENSVALYPKYDGRYPLISGFKFKFDPSLDPGSRVIRDSFVLENGEPIEMDK